MGKKYSRALFIFRRDLRLADNTGLLAALKDAETVYPIFIFTPEQVKNNAFKSNNAVQFMVESLEDLADQLRKKKAQLYLFYGTVESVLAKLIKRHAISAIYVNNDYTLFSKKRDKAIGAFCKKIGIDFCSFEDVCLHPIKTIRNKQDKCYLKFTPFFNRAKQYQVAVPLRNKYVNYYTGALTGTISLDDAAKRFFIVNHDIALHGGRRNALAIMRGITQFKNYNKTRDIPSIPTTRLSAHNKFGTVSIREVYYGILNKLGLYNNLMKQVYWRDFYYSLLDTYPTLYRKALKSKYDAIKWKINSRYLQAWKDGMTGFPFVDAGMRQMNTTGFMHNRARLVAASLLCKVLFINWRLGEKYFAQTLVDYDPAQNNGNWAWVSGSGADAQPYFRVFNPFLQSKRFDPDCIYIKQWIPQLKDVPVNHIHTWNLHAMDYKFNYPAPLVNYSAQKEKVQAAYKKALQ